MLNKLKRILNIITENQKNFVCNQEIHAVETIFEKIDKMYESLTDDIIRIEIGSDIAKFSDEITSVTVFTRQRIREEKGFIFPAIRFLDNLNIQENEIKIYLNGNELYSKFLIPNPFEILRDIEETLDDLFNNHLDEIFRSETVEKYLDVVKKYNSKLASDISYNFSSVEICYILKKLLKSGKSIKNINYIFERIAEELFLEKISNREKLEELSDKIFKNI